MENEFWSEMIRKSNRVLGMNTTNKQWMYAAEETVAAVDVSGVRGAL